MTTLMLYGDSVRSPEIRHEIAEAIIDTIIFVEHEGQRVAIGSFLEAPILGAREDVIDQFWTDTELGIDDILKDSSIGNDLIRAELARRALDKLGATAVTVPSSFPVAVADHLRGNGVDVRVDAELWAMRRRRKNPTELEGIERAQRAADVAMLSAAHMLRDAERTRQGELRFEGEIVTADWIREVMTAELVAQGTESDEILIQSGEASLGGHQPGSGPILPDQPCIIDLFPRDRKTGVYTDMSRTFVPGTPSERVVEIHRHCLVALDIAFEALVPGASDANRKVAEYFSSQGFATRLDSPDNEDLEEGFTHSLGHGVGLQVHERPNFGLHRNEPLIEGDVVAIEPGLYLRGVGGVRLEDTVLITADGIERFTDPFPYDLQP